MMTTKFYARWSDGTEITNPFELTDGESIREALARFRVKEFHAKRPMRRCELHYWAEGWFRLPRLIFNDPDLKKSAKKPSGFLPLGLLLRETEFITPQSKNLDAIAEELKRLIKTKTWVVWDNDLKKIFRDDDALSLDQKKGGTANAKI